MKKEKTMSEKNEVKIKTCLDLKTVVNYLESITMSLKGGSVAITKDDESIVLNPSKEITFELEASEKKDKEKLYLEISWLKKELIKEEKKVKLEISSKLPEVKKVPEKKNEAKKEEAKVALKKEEKSTETAKNDVKTETKNEPAKKEEKKISETKPASKK